MTAEYWNGSIWVEHSWDYGREGSGASAPIRLMRVPIASGGPEFVLEASRGATVRCALGHTPCVFSELDKVNGELVFSTFDPLRGKTMEMVRLAADPDGSSTWDLSPDGSTVAIVDLDERKERIRMVELDSGSAHSVAVGPLEHLSGISWSADGRGWFVASVSPGGGTLFRVGLDNSISKLWTTNTKLLMPLASPDSRSLAFSTSTYNSNAWVIENF